MKAAIHALKYDRLHPAAESSAGCCQAIAQLAEEAPAEMLWFHPAAPVKYTQRGFNQARALAEYALGFFVKPSGVAADAGEQRPDAAPLHRKPGGLTAHARARMSARLHSIESKSVDSKDILLVDEYSPRRNRPCRGARAGTRRSASVGLPHWPGRRIYEINQNANLEDAQDDIGLSGNAPAADRTQASIYSSHVHRKTNHLFDEG